MTLSKRNRQPQASASDTKSSDQRNSGEQVRRDIVHQIRKS